VSFAHLSSRIVDDEEVAVSRAIGMDVHRDFCEGVIVSGGQGLFGGSDRDHARSLAVVRVEPGAD
jgi:hypothetical protein